MKTFIKIIKWLLISIVTLLILAILYLRLSRFSDKMIYQTNGSNYQEFKSELNHEQFYFDVDTDVKLHGVLFKPDSINIIGTIFHYSGKGMHLNSTIQETYKPLLKKGFQVFCFERRDFGKSNGKAENSLTLKKDALLVFDKVTAMKNVINKPVIIWGQSLGGTFATMTVNAREEKINGLILEGTFSSFPDIGKVYANALNLENFKWLVPLLMNNDFPAEDEIKNITIPTVILHSKIDNQVPYELGKKIFNYANKNNTRFWDIDSKHIMAIYDYEEEYVEAFIKMLD